MKKNNVFLLLGAVTLYGCGGGGDGSSDTTTSTEEGIPADFKNYELTTYNSGSIFAKYSIDDLDLLLTDSNQIIFTDSTTAESATYRYSDDRITIDLAGEVKGTFSDGELKIYLYDEDATITIPMDTSSLFSEAGSQASLSTLSDISTYANANPEKYAYFRFLDQDSTNVTDKYNLDTWTTFDGHRIPIDVTTSSSALPGNENLYTTVSPLVKDDQFYADAAARYREAMLETCDTSRDKALTISQFMVKAFEFGLNNVVKALFPGNGYVKAIQLLNKIRAFDVEKVSTYLICKANRTAVESKLAATLTEEIHPLIQRYNDYKANTSNTIIVDGEVSFGGGDYNVDGIYGYPSGSYQPYTITNLYVHNLQATNTVITDIIVKVPRRIQLVHVTSPEGIGTSETRDVSNKKVSVKVGSNPSLEPKESGTPASNDIELVVTNSDSSYSETYTVSGAEIDSNGYAVLDLPAGQSGTTDYVKATYIGTLDPDIKLESGTEISKIDYQVVEASCSGYTELHSNKMTFDQASAYCESIGMVSPTYTDLINIGGAESLSDSCGWNTYDWVWSGTGYNDSTAWAVPGRMDGLRTVWLKSREFSVTCKMN